jgi:hypothetical protein
MRKMLAISGAVLGLSVLNTAAPAVAAPHAHGCKVVSTTTVVQTLPPGTVTGISHGEPVFSKTPQHRTATTTVTKCKGRTSSTTTFTAWK